MILGDMLGYVLAIFLQGPLSALVWIPVLLLIGKLLGTPRSNGRKADRETLSALAREADRSVEFNEKLGRMGVNQGGKAH